jgi:hypothetical protein
MGAGGRRRSHGREVRRTSSHPAGFPLWASNTAGWPGSRLEFQGDGNLVIYAAAGQPIWASNTAFP